jgi:predicted ArsR family transcriptional regulator
MSKNLKQRIYAKLDANTWITTKDIAARCGITVENARYYLNMMVEAGGVEQESQLVRDEEAQAACGRRYVYRLRTADDVCHEALLPLVKPAYHNLRLSENLTGYGDSLSRFAALCMMVRK